MKKKKYYAAQLLIKIDNKRSQEEMFPEQLSSWEHLLSDKSAQISIS